MPDIDERTWAKLGLYPHLREQWIAGKWRHTEVRVWTDGRKAIVADGGAVVLGVVPANIDADTVRAMLRFIG
jgi:hypothetical protein